MPINKRAAEITTLLGRLVDLLADQQPQTEPPEARRLPPRTLLTVDEAAELLGLGRTKTYSLVTSGELESVRIGRLRRVHIDAIHDYAARLVASHRRMKGSQT